MGSFFQQKPVCALYLISSFFLYLLGYCRAAKAQAIPDVTLPSNTVVIPNGNTSWIEGGTRVGGNLFHSFQEFSVLTGNQAFFNNAADIQNILSRVTGGNISNIDGLIRANGTANLFLINPNGIIFGSNAQLNIGGSFIGSTANSFKFTDGSEFSAINPSAPPLLAINVPIGLQLGPNPGSIRVQGSGHDLRFNSQTGVLETGNVSNNLSVQPGNTLALVGGEVVLEGGNLIAGAGQIQLWALSSGQLSVNFDGSQLTFIRQEPTELGDIRLTQSASVSTSGNPGGSLQVQARRLTLEEGSAIYSLTQGSEPGNSLSVNASESVELLGRTPDGRFPSSLLTRTNSTGTGGALSVTTDRLLLRDGAAIASNTDGSGNAGTLTIQAREVTLGGLSANGSRLTGIFTNPNIPSTGRGGDVTVETEQLTIEDGAVISVSTFGAGQGGSLTVQADRVEIRGTSADGRIRSGFYARTTLNPVTQLTGNAGNVTVIADTVSLSDRATINVSNLGTGDGGNVDIRANTVELDNRAVITATVTQGKQANITIQSQDLQLRRNSLITTNASNIIRTDAGDAIASDNPSSNGGNITINTNTLVALENSDITANSQQAFGGRVTINAQGIFGTQVREQNTLESDITSTGGRPELRGTVEINTPTVNSVSELVQLPENFTDASNQITTGCAADQGNSFTLTGRGGLAEDPSQTLRGRTVWRDLRPLVARGEEGVTRTETYTSRGGLPILNPQSSIVEAQGWMINVKGEVELVANAPQLTLQTSQFRPTDCRKLVN